MVMSGRIRRFYEFGPFHIDTAEQLLLRDGRPVQLTQKAFDTLIALVENRGRLLEKDELMRIIWPDAFVEEANLANNISLLRKILGDRADNRLYIETIPRRGYRFVASVKELENGSQKDEAIAAVRSIAVLPFKPLNPDDGDEYLGLGIADALITRLGNIRKIIVRPTSAVRKYTGLEQDPVEAGRELRVESVLEGGIQRSGERIRVTVQLVDISNSAPLWADKFDEKFTDIFTVQDSISEKVAGSLMLKLTSEERRLLTKRYTENTEAYRLYLQGLHYKNKGTKDSALKAIEYFNHAIEIDPHYALAYTGLAGSYCWLSHVYSDPRETAPKAKAAAERALELDDSLAEAHTSLARLSISYDWNWPAAEREYLRAIELNPNYAEAHQWYGFYLTVMGRFDEAIREIDRAQELDPLSFMRSAFRGWSLYFARRYDEAIEQFRKLVEMDPNFHMAYWGLGMAYDEKGEFSEAIAEFQKALSTPDGGGAEMITRLGHVYATSGKKEEAQRLLAELEEMSARRYVSPMLMARIHTGLDEKERAFEFLERAFTERSPWMVYLKVDPVFDNLRSDPRFANLVRRMGLS